LIDSLAHEPDEKIPVDAFIMMQWDEIEIVQTQNGGD
jgi:hypothetical protein